MLTKKCTECKLIKALTEFGKNGFRFQCKSCIKEYDRKRYEKNSEKLKKYQQNYRKNNPERAKESNRKWRKKYPERVKESRQKHKEKYPERIKEYERKRKEKNRKSKQNIKADINFRSMLILIQSQSTG